MDDNKVESHSGEHARRTGLSAFRHPTRRSSLLLLVADILAFGMAYVAFRWTPARGLSFVAIVLVFLMIRGHYRTRMARNIGEDLSMVAGAVAAAVLAVVVGVTVFDLPEPHSSTLVAASLGMFLVLMASRTLAFGLIRRLRTRGQLRSRALVVGTGPIAREIGVEFEHRGDYGIDIVGYVSRSELRVDAHLSGPVVGNLSDLADLVRITGCDRVIVTLGAEPDGDVVDALRSLPVPGTSIFVMPQLFELGMGGDTLTPERARGFALVRLGRSAHPVIGLHMKRVFDIVTSGIALVVLSPLLAVAALAVRLSSKGPVLFRQERVGRYGATFELFKFRSMRVNTDSDVAWTPESSDSLVTPVGNFLRRSSIDELPQLLNIFRGDMSVVGARPERPAFVEQFENTVPGYRYRHRMPMGLTGLAQVRGLRGDTPIDERVKYDNLYIDQWSFFGDLSLITRTFWSILHQRAYAEAEIDMSRVLAEVDEHEQVVVDLVAEERREDSETDTEPTGLVRH